MLAKDLKYGDIVGIVYAGGVCNDYIGMLVDKNSLPSKGINGTRGEEYINFYVLHNCKKEDLHIIWGIPRDSEVILLKNMKEW